MRASKEAIHDGPPQLTIVGGSSMPCRAAEGDSPTKGIDESYSLARDGIKVVAPIPLPDDPHFEGALAETRFHGQTIFIGTPLANGTEVLLNHR